MTNVFLILRVYYTIGREVSYLCELGYLNVKNY